MTQVVVLPNGERRRIADPPTGSVPAAKVRGSAAAAPPTEPTCRAPLGAVLGARSGDKGGNANIGLWARDDAGYAWVREHLTVERLRGLLGPEAAQLRIERFELPNLRALNVVVHGLLGKAWHPRPGRMPRRRACASTCAPASWTYRNPLSARPDKSRIWSSRATLSTYRQSSRRPLPAA